MSMRIASPQRISNCLNQLVSYLMSFRMSQALSSFGALDAMVQPGKPGTRSEHVSESCIL